MPSSRTGHLRAHSKLPAGRSLNFRSQTSEFQMADFPNICTSLASPHSLSVMPTSRQCPCFSVVPLHPPTTSTSHSRCIDGSSYPRRARLNLFFCSSLSLSAQTRNCPSPALPTPGGEPASEMTLVMLIACTFLTILSKVSFSHCADFCSWETTSNSKSYSFNLVTSVGHNHGIRSEDGFYKITEREADGTDTTFWFQPCQHMEFNYDAPMCDNCESCGGPLHCGETCSALQASFTGGFPVCTTLGFASNQSYSLINLNKPETGVIVKMIAVTPTKSCSLSISVYCSLKKEELPTTMTKDAPGKCNYATSIRHSAGCPIVTSVKGGGMGWFGTLLIVLLCGLIVYFAVGIAYRMTVLGVSGLEAFPHLDFWKALPHNIQLGFEAVHSFVMSCYRRFTEPTYTRQ